MSKQRRLWCGNFKADVYLDPDFARGLARGLVHLAFGDPTHSDSYTVIIDRETVRNFQRDRSGKGVIYFTRRGRGPRAVQFPHASIKLIRACAWYEPGQWQVSKNRGIRIRRDAWERQLTANTRAMQRNEARGAPRYCEPDGSRGRGRVRSGICPWAATPIPSLELFERRYGPDATGDGYCYGTCGVLQPSRRQRVRYRDSISSGSSQT